MTLDGISGEEGQQKRTFAEKAWTRQPGSCDDLPILYSIIQDCQIFEFVIEHCRKEHAQF